MPILLKTQVDRTAKTPVTARRARVGGLCGFRRPAERVPAGSPKTGRCTAVRERYADDQCQSRSEYIEKAILFYTGFLYAEKADRYLPKVLQQILAGTLDRFAERIGRQLFKLAVEQNVNNHILASDTDIDARSYQKMRGLSMDEVKRTNGRIDFEDALLSERGV